MIRKFSNKEFCCFAGLKSLSVSRDLTVEGAFSMVGGTIDESEIVLIGRE